MNTGTTDQLEPGDSIASLVHVGEVIAGKYVVERLLGMGGMGVVVAARDRFLDRPVAIKFLLPKLSGTESSVQRFAREARAATRVTSEHVVRLLEIDKLPSGIPFFVMEYLQGSDLRALLRERGPLAPALAVDYILQALQAVAEGHLKGIVHRDIKPGNLFLSSRADGTPLLKVLDFGIAKTLEGETAESSALTSSDDVRLGSPAYMPPEQLQNPRDVDTRSDIWSVGATLYELVSGRPPFEGSGYLELATRILTSPPPPIGQSSGQPLPRGLEAVIRKCLEKERSLRYANAAELATALAPFGSDDARVSLTRVKGMWGSRSLGAITTRTGHDSGSVATALSVAGEGRPSPTSNDHRQTNDIGPADGRKWVRAALVVAFAGALVAATLALRPVPPSQASASVAFPSVVTGAPAAQLSASSSTPATLVPAAPPSSPPSLPAAVVTVRAALGERPTSRRSTPRVASTAVSASVLPAASAAPTASVLSAAPAQLSESSERAGVGESAGGLSHTSRSAEIERLIERRR
jgi:eukaryotic-like serine/threonine-protein kinase